MLSEGKRIYMAGSGGMLGEGFREPSLIELYASPTSALTGAQDVLPGPNEGGFRPNLGGPPTPVRSIPRPVLLLPMAVVFQTPLGLSQKRALL